MSSNAAIASTTATTTTTVTGATTATDCHPERSRGIRRHVYRCISTEVEESEIDSPDFSARVEMPFVCTCLSLDYARDDRCYCIW